MNIPQIQSQLAVNRTLIQQQHVGLRYALDERSHMSQSGQPERAALAHRSVVKVRKNISRMVALQKTLKFDLSCIIEKQRRSREITKQNEVRITAMIQAGEVV